EMHPRFPAFVSINFACRYNIADLQIVAQAACNSYKECEARFEKIQDSFCCCCARSIAHSGLNDSDGASSISVCELPYFVDCPMFSMFSPVGKVGPNRNKFFRECGDENGAYRG